MKDFSSNPNSIKYYVKKFFYRERKRFSNKTIVDFPAGNGVTSRILKDIGAHVLAFDLFPEYFKQADIICQHADINEGLPLESKAVDAIICQEGIEHFSDQLMALKKFNELLRPKGSLILTTPNYSNLRAKLSYLLGESERFSASLAANELDSIWMLRSKESQKNKIYFGHVFLIGIERLRCLAKFSGFRIKKIERTKMKYTSLLLLPLFLPFIYLTNYLAYKRSMKRNTRSSWLEKKKTYGEVFKLATSLRILTDSHLFVEFEKECDHQDVAKNLHSQSDNFGLT